MVKNDLVAVSGSYLEISEIKNLSSDINLLNSSESPEILGCDANSLTFNYFGIACAEGNLIMIQGNLADGNKQPVKFSFVGKVIELEAIGARTNRVTIKLNQYDKDVWQKFITNLRKQQEHIDKLLQTIKGDE